MAQQPVVDVLVAAADQVTTSSTKQRITIFRDTLIPLVKNKEVSADSISQVVDIIFRTLYVYDDRPSRKAVEDLIVELLGEVTHMKSFAASLVQSMEKQSKVQTPLGSHKLLKWSCLLLRRSQFSSVSRNAILRLFAGQAFLLQYFLKCSFRMQRACKKAFFHLFKECPGIYEIYVEELKNSGISCRDSASLIWLLLEFSTTIPSYFERYKPIFIDLYVKAILNAKEKPAHTLSEAFYPLFSHMVHEDLKSIVIPSSLKMLKRNPEIVLESVGDLLKSVNLDLSKYVTEFLPVITPQIRHSDDRRRIEALVILGCLSQKSSDPDAPFYIFNTIKAVIGGSEGKLTSTYHRVGMINALQEVSKVPTGKLLNSLTPSIASFLLSYYKDDGSEEVKLAILSALACWAAKSSDVVYSDFVSFILVGLKEKETLRKAHLRCMRVLCKNPDALEKVSPLLEPLVQLVKTGFTKASQRLDGVYALFSVLKIMSANARAEDILTKEKIWSLILDNESPFISTFL